MRILVPVGAAGAVFLVLVISYFSDSCCVRPVDIIEFVEDPRCRTGLEHRVTIRSVGEFRWRSRPTISLDQIVVQMDDWPVTCSWAGDLQTGHTASCATSFNTTQGMHKVRVIGPNNVLNKNDYCD